MTTRWCSPSRTRPAWYRASDSPPYCYSDRWAGRDEGLIVGPVEPCTASGKNTGTPDAPTAHHYYRRPRSLYRHGPQLRGCVPEPRWHALADYSAGPLYQL